MDRAVKELLKDSNTNFDSLIKNLENNITLKELIKKITVDGSEITYNKDNPTINLGVIYGIFKDERGKLKLHNRIYEQKIYDYMSSLKEVKGGEEKRFDIVITYEKKIYILELKIWRGYKYHEKGIVQLGEYLEQYGLEEGYLLIFDFRKVKELVGKVEEIITNVNEKQKKIVEVYC